MSWDVFICEIYKRTDFRFGTLNFDTGELVLGNQLTITNATKLEFTGLSPKI